MFWLTLRREIPRLRFRVCPHRPRTFLPTWPTFRFCFIMHHPENETKPCSIHWNCQQSAAAPLTSHQRVLLTPMSHNAANSVTSLSCEAYIVYHFLACITLQNQDRQSIAKSSSYSPHTASNPTRFTSNKCITDKTIFAQLRYQDWLLTYSIPLSYPLAVSPPPLTLLFPPFSQIRHTIYVTCEE